MKRFTLVAVHLDHPKATAIARAAKKLAGVGEVIFKNEPRRAGEFRFTIDARNRKMVEGVRDIVLEHNGNARAEIQP